MVKTKRATTKRSISSKKGTARSIHILRGIWQNEGLNLSQYRLVVGCSLETQKK